MDSTLPYRKPYQESARPLASRPLALDGRWSDPPYSCTAVEQRAMSVSQSDAMRGAEIDDDACCVACLQSIHPDHNSSSSSYYYSETPSPAKTERESERERTSPNSGTKVQNRESCWRVINHHANQRRPRRPATTPAQSNPIISDLTRDG